MDIQRYRRLLLTNKFFGALRVGWLIVRPGVLFLFVAGLLARYLRYGRRKLGISTGVAGISSALWILRGILKDRFRPKESHGLFTVRGSRVARISRVAGLESRKYRPHPLLWTGDLKTVVPAVLADIRRSRKDRRYRRCVLDGDVSCDFMIPNPPKNCERLAILVPGIGGDSSAPYVLECASYLSGEDNWIVCVVNPRSDPDSTSAVAPGRDDEDPTRAFDPVGFVDDLALVVRHLCEQKRGASSLGPWMEEDTTFRHVAIVGFSLGAIVTSKYLASRKIPPVVRCGICVSGAFSLDFALWRRYAYFYQAVIVPTLVEKFETRYGLDAIRRRLGDRRTARLFGARNYKELVESCSSTVSSGGDDGGSKHMTRSSFGDFRKGLEVDTDEIRAISRPLLLLTSLDDPLHHADLIGLSKIRAAANDNIAVLVTRYGGHVLWPEGSSPFERPSCGFLRETVAAFADAATRE